MSTAKTINFRALQAELDAIMNKLQETDFDIDEAIIAYERGMEIVADLEKYLKQAENKVTKLQAKFDTNSSPKTK